MKDKLTKGLIALSFSSAIFLTGGFGLATGVTNAAPGNNGTIKIDSNPVDNDNNNEPHVGCSFTLEFFGYDSGSQVATVSFSAQAPSGSGPVTPSSGSSVLTFTGSGPGNHLDKSETYTLNTSGLALQAQQGYHIKVSVEVTGSKGSDDKFKVFWVQPCVGGSGGETPPPVTTGTTPPTVTPTTTTVTATGGRGAGGTDVTTSGTAAASTVTAPVGGVGAGFGGGSQKVNSASMVGLLSSLSFAGLGLRKFRKSEV